MGFFLGTCLLIIFCVPVQGQIITTIAGNGFDQGTGTGGFSGDGGEATDAELNFPWGVAVDDSGNAYIADEYNNRIRKVSAASGIITTFAGTGAGGFSGDNGQAIFAELNYPTALALDTSGNLYIADRLNNRIREINVKTGIINTIAGDNTTGGFSGDGGPATDAKLDQPFGVAVDDSGNVYIVDYANDRIRKVSVSTGFITTIAGTGKAGFSGDSGPAVSAELNYPLGVAVDDSGNVYIGDYINNRIRKVKSSTGIITTIAGDGVQGYSGDGGPATDANFYNTEGVAVDDSGDVYIADFYNNLIRKINQSTDIITTFAGNGFGAGNGYGGESGDGGPSTSAELYFPVGVCTDASGNVYIADNYNNRIRKVTVCEHNLSVNPASYSMCNGQSVTLNVNDGALYYTWSPGIGLNTTQGDTVIATPAATITYTVTSNFGDCAEEGIVIVTIIQGTNKPTITKRGDLLTSSATQGNQWVLNDTAIDGANNETYELTTAGCYSVIVSNPANGCSSTSDTICVTTIEGINQFQINSNQLSIYPNPTCGELFINISSLVADMKGWNLQITDVLGRTIYAKLSLNYSNDIDLSNLSSGVYFITIKNKTSRILSSIVKL